METGWADRCSSLRTLSQRALWKFRATAFVGLPYESYTTSRAKSSPRQSSAPFVELCGAWSAANNRCHRCSAGGRSQGGGTLRCFVAILTVMLVAAFGDSEHGPHRDHESPEG